ncbi:MAG: Na/Pi cotransporter family protein [Lachnospiraceae bacterium]|jgi:hypothetical protein|nr:Na/Pi cotransporter family protein [Lachnospiraceae bacterium]
MDVKNIANLFGFVGGLGMFLYGMHIMSEGIQKTAGGKMQQFLGMLTNNRLMAIGLGALITAIIHSSGATTVMVVGFVNAGILTLTQAVGVIMGANIGTTITAWLVSMSQMGDSLAILTPEFDAPLLIGVGAMLILFAKSEKKHLIGEIVIGVGFLFLGLKYMSSSISPYAQLPIFSQAFAILGKNPIFGMLAGAVVTALLQSSSASVGILQTLALNGVVNMSSAIYITLGQNIGTCVTALISSVGSSRTAKRAAVIHFLFNTLGAVVFGIGGFIFFNINKKFATSNMTAVDISIFHTLFNSTMTLILLPFVNQLVSLSGVFVKGTDEVAEQGATVESPVDAIRQFDQRIFETPAFALEAATLEIIHMGHITLENTRTAIDAVLTGDKEKIAKVFTVEKTINEMEEVLIEYLIKVDNLPLGEHQKLVVNDLFYTVSDIERVGDHAENLVENMQYLEEKKLQFSEVAVEDLKRISEKVYKALEAAIDARRNPNMDEVRKVNELEDQVDNLEDELREKHIDRLSKKQCKTEAGVIFLDIVSNLERMSDHASNLAGYIAKEL